MSSEEKMTDLKKVAEEIADLICQAIWTRSLEDADNSTDRDFEFAKNALIAYGNKIAEEAAKIAEIKGDKQFYDKGGLVDFAQASIAQAIRERLKVGG